MGCDGGGQENADYPDLKEGFRREDLWLVEHCHEKADSDLERRGTLKCRNNKIFTVNPG